MVTSLSPAVASTPAGVSGQLDAAVCEGVADALTVGSAEELGLADGLAEALADGSAVGEPVLDESLGLGVADGLGSIEAARAEGVTLGDGDGLTVGDVTLGVGLGLAVIEAEPEGLGARVAGQGADVVGSAVCAFAAMGGSTAITMAVVDARAIEAQSDRGLFM